MGRVRRCRSPALTQLVAQAAQIYLQTARKKQQCQEAIEQHLRQMRPSNPLTQVFADRMPGHCIGGDDRDKTSSGRNSKATGRGSRSVCSLATPIATARTRSNEAKSNVDIVKFCCVRARRCKP